MENQVVINTERIDKYASDLAKRQCDLFFENKTHISGSEVLHFCSFKQINLFLLKLLYEKWRTTMKAARSPYFDFEHPDVHQAFTQYSNALSQNIRLERHLFEEILIKATRDTFNLLLKPNDFYLAEIQNFEGDIVDHSTLNTIQKYIDINSVFYTELLNGLNKNQGTTVEKSELFTGLKIVYHINQDKAEKFEEYQHEFELLYPLGDISEYWTENITTSANTSQDIFVPEEPITEPTSQDIFVPEEPITEPTSQDIFVPEEPIAEPTSQDIFVPEEPIAEPTSQDIFIPEEPIAEPTSQDIFVPEEPIAEPTSQDIFIPEEPITEPTSQDIFIPEEPIAEPTSQDIFIPEGAELIQSTESDGYDIFIPEEPKTESASQDIFIPGEPAQNNNIELTEPSQDIFIPKESESVQDKIDPKPIDMPQEAIQTPQTKKYTLDDLLTRKSSVKKKMSVTQRFAFINQLFQGNHTSFNLFMNDIKDSSKSKAIEKLEQAHTDYGWNKVDAKIRQDFINTIQDMLEA